MNTLGNAVVLESSPCPVGCALNDKKILEGHDRQHGLPGDYTVVRCLECGLERTDPRPAPESMGFYYPDDYGPYNTVPVDKSSPVSWWKGIIITLLQINHRRLPIKGPGRMLEIGCSTGLYMEEARDTGWEVDGIEFSEHAAKIAQAKGFDVQIGSVESSIAPTKPYDAVVGWMVLEHLHRPVDVLVRLREWVAEDGYLVISVPDSRSISRWLFKDKSFDLQLPNHLYHYDDKSIKKMLEVSGWRVDKIWWQRNCNTLLWSLYYWLEESGYIRLAKIANWLRVAPVCKYIRLPLSILLGFTRQSGRIEVWARRSGVK